MSAHPASSSSTDRPSLTAATDPEGLEANMQTGLASAPSAAAASCACTSLGAHPGPGDKASCGCGAKCEPANCVQVSATGTASRCATKPAQATPRPTPHPTNSPPKDPHGSPGRQRTHSADFALHPASASSEPLARPSLE
eukprot:4711955-Alexandrium_andersonii.AAC.1